MTWDAFTELFNCLSFLRDLESRQALFEDLGILYPDLETRAGFLKRLERVWNGLGTFSSFWMGSESLLLDFHEDQNPGIQRNQGATARQADHGDC